MPRKMALIVSIENYQNPIHNLPGIGRDVEAFVEVLGRFGIHNHESLKDKNANQQGIVNGLKNLVSRAAEGDVLVFYFTGHGTRIPVALAGGEQRSLEAFVPWEGDTNRVIPDLWIKSFLQERLPAGVSFYGFYDSCHSGEMYKYLSFGAEGRVDKNWQVSKALFAKDLDDTGVSKLVSGLDFSKRFETETDLKNSVHFGGSEPENTALVKMIGGEKRSCFTYALDRGLNTGISIGEMERAVAGAQAVVTDHHAPVLATGRANLNSPVFESLV